MPLTIDISFEDPRWEELGLARLADSALGVVVSHLGLKVQAEVSLLACDDTRIAELNADFRDKPAPTNVLSWPSEERSAEEDGGRPLPPIGPDPELGDIAIAYETCAREAAADGKTMVDHTTHLLVHGMLHLLGYDHERDGDAALMEGIEVEILGILGIDDPYMG